MVNGRTTVRGAAVNAGGGSASPTAGAPREAGLRAYDPSDRHLGQRRLFGRTWLQERGPMTVTEMAGPCRPPFCAPARTIGLTAPADAPAAGPRPAQEQGVRG
ncbi:hypothetical protein GCM10020227_61290 [Streptomyces flavovirens]